MLAVAISRCGAGEFAPARGGDPRPPPSHAPQRAEDAFGIGIDQLNPADPEAVDETLSPPGPDVADRQEHQGHGTRHPSDARRMVGGLCSALGSRRGSPLPPLVRSDSRRRRSLAVALPAKQARAYGAS